MMQPAPGALARRQMVGDDGCVAHVHKQGNLFGGEANQMFVAVVGDLHSASSVIS
jgi:hypothetical protein